MTEATEHVCTQTFFTEKFNYVWSPDNFQKNFSFEKITKVQKEYL